MRTCGWVVPACGFHKVEREYALVLMVSIKLNVNTHLFLRTFLFPLYQLESEYAIFSGFHNLEREKYTEI